MYEKDLMQRYNAMVARCYSKNSACHKYYADKGITVCDEWLSDFSSFYSWALNNGYSKDLSLDRIDNDGNYEPNNCRWATKLQQNNNKSNSHKVEYEGKIMGICEWARELEISVGEVYKKINSGWGNDLNPCNPIEKLDTQPNKMLIEIRQNMRYTQKQFGELLGVGQSLVAQWESGDKFPQTEQLYKLSEIEGVSITKLLKDRLNQKKGAEQ